jgi:hypothetical protein
MESSNAPFRVPEPMTETDGNLLEKLSVCNANRMQNLQSRPKVFVNDR